MCVTIIDLVFHFVEKCVDTIKYGNNFHLTGWQFTVRVFLKCIYN